MSRIAVKVIANARKPGVIDEEGGLKVKVNAPAVDGRANKQVIKMLARHFKVKESEILIVKGEKNPHKEIEIGGDSNKACFN